MSEEHEAKRDGARLQKNSGRGQFQKGDATMNGALGTYVIDYKEYVTKKGIRVDRDMWTKLTTDTWMTDREGTPVLKVVLGEGEEKIRLAVVPWEHLMKLNEVAQ